MVITDKFDRMGIPPQLSSTMTGLNNLMTDLGFPKWTLVKWPVPPLMTFWLFIVMLLAGLRWFAIFQIMFVIYKTFEEYGEPVSDWMHQGVGRRGRTLRPSSRARSPNLRRSSRTRKSSQETHDEDESDN